MSFALRAVDVEAILRVYDDVLRVTISSQQGKQVLCHPAPATQAYLNVLRAP